MTTFVTVLSLLVAIEFFYQGGLALLTLLLLLLG